MNRLRNLAFAMTVAAGAASMGAACSAKKNTELVVAVQTDLRIPKDLNAVNIKIVALGGTYFDQTFAVGPGGVHLPQTIGIVPNDEDKLQPVDVTVSGKFGSDIASSTDVVIRRVRVTFAKDRVGLVRMPLRFTCYGKTNECGDSETCVSGKCVPIPDLKGEDLPPFTSEAVFGAGGDNEKIGKCWSPEACLPSSAPLQKIGSCVYSLTAATEVDAGGSDATTKPDGGGGPIMDASATPDAAIPVDAGAGSGSDGGAGGADDAGSSPPDAMPYMWKRFEDPSKISVVVANYTGGTDHALGYCDSSGCKLPIDFDANEGWSWADDSHTSIKLAQGLCDAIGTAQVQATDACETKTSELPFCDENAGAGDDAGPASDSSIPDSSTGDDSGVKCPPDEMFCGDVGCVDTRFDRNNCGMCGRVCAPSEGCNFSTCVGTSTDGGICPAPMTMCGAICTDLKTDSNNCGFCGNVCPAGGKCFDTICMGSGADASPPPDTMCTPVSCGMFPGKCDPMPDGCGGTMVCPCPGGTSCIGGACMPSGADAGADTCVKRTCADLAAECGVQSDGCGGLTANCGTCDAGSSCMPGGKCMPVTCVPSTCSAMGYNCGPAPDGCGGTLMCGTCSAPMICGGGGMPNHCGLSGSDAGVDADGGTDTCDATPAPTTPLRQGWHLAAPPFGTPMNAGPTLTSVSVSGSAGFTVGSCSTTGAALFNGTSSYLYGTDGSLGAAINSLEVSAWVYLDPLAPPAANSTLISTVSGTKGFFVGADASGKPTFVVYMSDGSTRSATASTATIASAGWYHFTGTAIAGKPIQLFSNGAPLGTGAVIDKTLAPMTDVAIGRALTGATGYWNGRIAEIRVHGN
jgi:hypothetical protein